MCFGGKKDARAMRKKEYWANASAQGWLSRPRWGFGSPAPYVLAHHRECGKEAPLFFKWKIELPLIICSFGYIHSRMSAEAGIIFHLF